MAIIRVNKNYDYTVMSNSHFREKEMSLKAKGLLSLILSLPEEWDYSVDGLASLSKDGRDSVSVALRELEKFKYLVRRISKLPNGKFDGYIYDIYENPQTEKPLTEKPLTEKPLTEKPLTEIPTQLNTYPLITNISNTNYNKICKSVSCETIASNESENLFLKFWEIYPRKQEKKKAQSKFITLVTKHGIEFAQTIIDGAKAYSEWITRNKQESYIKMPTTWINGECWNDELPDMQIKSSNSSLTVQGYAKEDYDVSFEELFKK